MDDPVLDHCAHCFERSAILEWLRQGHGCCPISRKPLDESDLVSNQILSDQISSWKERNAEKLACREIDPSNERTMPVDVDGLVSDVERGLSRKLGHQRRRYQAVPVRAKMFLPQELKAMEMAKIRAALERSEWRRRVCILATKIVVLALLTFTAASIVIWKIFYQHQIEGNEP